MNADWRNRHDAARAAAEEAGRFALQYFDQGIAVEWKPDQSPVTMADRGAEQLLRKKLLELFPGDGFLGEEFGDTPGTSGYRWIIDPIDGTRSFVRGIPIWACMIGLEHKGELIAGVVYLPAMRQAYHALRGNGAFRDERRIRVSDVADLARAHVYYSSISWFHKAGHTQQFLNLVHCTERQRGFGDFYGFMMVAQGSGEIMVEHGVHAWDLGAIVPIVEEAGGLLTAWDGKLDIDKPDVLASNRLLHKQALEIMNHVPEAQG
ncbi:MAG: histidinol phosphate phosphatase [Planctomycetes bacterium]|nr:histidinol phosphate phosphatase [Planctomycetota bacterium]